MIRAIFAMDSAGGIGHESSRPGGTKGKYGLPWDLNSTDLEYFREMTTGQIVVMGRKTWENLPDHARPLKGRINAIVSSKPIYHPKTFIRNINSNNIDKGIKELSETFKDKEVFIIGGKQLIMSTLHLIDWMHITHIRGIYEANLRMDKRELLKDFRLRGSTPLYNNCSFEDYIRGPIPS